MRLEGRFVALEPLSLDGGRSAIDEFDRLRVFMPRTAGARLQRRTIPSEPGAPLLVRRRSSGSPLGILAAQRRDGMRYVELTLFADPARIRPGEPLEGYLLCARHLLEHGTERVEVRILSGDLEVVRIMEKLEFVPDAVLRRAAYAAGRFHDVLVCSVSVDDHAVLARLEARLGGVAEAGAAR